MRKVIFSSANSVDNLLARSDHSVDWIMPSEEAADIMSTLWKTIDTILMGRKTYDFAVRNGQGNGYPGLQTCVFSRTLAPREGPVTVVSEDAVEFVRRLKQQEGKDICLMCGSALAAALFEADLIDEIGLNIHPMLLGSGIPLFQPMSRQINLELKECQRFKNGCVYISYRVIHPSN